MQTKLNFRVFHSLQTSVKNHGIITPAKWLCLLHKSFEVKVANNCCILFAEFPDYRCLDPLLECPEEVSGRKLKVRLISVLFYVIGYSRSNSYGNSYGGGSYGYNQYNNFGGNNRNNYGGGYGKRGSGYRDRNYDSPKGIKCYNNIHLFSYSKSSLTIIECDMKIALSLINDKVVFSSMARFSLESYNHGYEIVLFEHVTVSWFWRAAQWLWGWVSF